MSVRTIRRILAGIGDGIRARLPSRFKGFLRPALHAFRQARARRAIARTPAARGARRRYSAIARHVVFVSNVPRVREAKLAHGLRRRGWNVSLLYGERPNYDLQKHFDSAESFGDPAEAVRLASRHTPVAYHVFSPSGDLASTEVVNARLGPTVFDATDILEISYLGNSAKIEATRYAIDLQKHCIRHADGYCARDLQLKLAQKQIGYPRSSRTIFFPEFCWGIASVSIRSRAEEGRQLRCVQAGNFGIEKLGEGDWGYLGIAEKFIQAGVGLEIYPNWTHYARGEAEFTNIFADYLALARSTDLFRLYRPVSVDALHETLRQYDFGVYFVSGELLGQRVTSVNPASLRYCMGARVFDYLDAGLPVLLNASFALVCAMLRRYGAGIAVDADFLERLGPNLAALAAQDMNRRAVHASHGLAVARHIHRLENFYGRIAAGAGISAG